MSAREVRQVDIWGPDDQEVRDIISSYWIWHQGTTRPTLAP